ncbi:MULTISPECIES: hypothetical protein [unclassified Micromonospora]|uniref:hypothetical protein n=1 Tax=unclassified Micromonospora TaxID=2617518 RepID=UPI003645DB9C
MRDRSTGGLPDDDRTANPEELVSSTEAARLLGYSRPEKLPQALLAEADVTERRDDGTVKRRLWRRKTLWRYADRAMVTGNTIIAGRPAVDRAGLAALTGVTLATVDRWIAESSSNGFPSVQERRWYYIDEVQRWHTERQAEQRSRLSVVDRSGDPDELVTKEQAARIVGYAKGDHLDNSPLWAALRERNDPGHNVALPSGRSRLRWPRRVVWEVADARTGRRGRPAGASAATRVIDRSGDPDELVGAAEATRVLGYRHPSGLPRGVLDRADVPLSPGTSRKWRRSTLWAIADESTKA